jgi:glycosyltransferase involved in cell wall biosynthesis
MTLQPASEEAVADRPSSAQTKILLELRPALEGFAGIPQETRLLYRGLRLIDGMQVDGMLQTYRMTLARGTLDDGRSRPSEANPSLRVDRYSRVIISMAERPYRTLLDKIVDYATRESMTTFLAAGLALKVFLRFRRVRTTNFETRHFSDFVWRTLFSKTLPVADFAQVTAGTLKICSTPWNVMHRAGLLSLNLSSRAKYPVLDTRGVDVFIAQTPFPARVTPGTTMVVRYHDALPVLMPHTIPDKSVHQATHFHALRENVSAGAYFACISASTRDDLLKLFPEAADKAVVIHNMVSHHYFLEDSPRALVPGIIRSRLYQGVKLQPTFFSNREQEGFYRRCLGADFRYLMIVSTIEPRKNHARLLAAWEVIKAELDPDLKLVVVGTLGWDNSQLTAQFKTWIDRGELFMLNAVPAPDLRVLYRHAAATVCPSLGEGFDYSGVEAMASGGIVASSDIPVHREIYEDASEYFNPYATGELVKALRRMLYAEDRDAVQAELRRRSVDIVRRYQPEAILPQWTQFLDRVAAEKSA